MEDEEGGAAASRPPPSKPAFTTQAGALLRKNLRYQQKNCGTNCCLVLTPLVFSVVLGVVSYVINTVLFGGADYKCGCLCTTYTTPDGTSFSFSAQTATRTVGGAPVTRFAPTQFNNSNYPTGPVWNAQLVDPFTNTTYDWQYGQMTCGPTDASKCGIQYSAVAQSGFCAITSPLRYVPLVQVPNPAFRPPNGANGLSYATGPGAGEYYTNPASTGVSGTSYVSASFANFSAPSPFLFTGANKSLATSLASGMLFENASKALLASFPSAAALQRFISHGVPGDTSVFGLNNDTSRLAEVIPLYPSSIGSNSAGLSPFLLGTAASTPRGGIQKEPGLNGAVIMVLLPNCSSGFSAAALGSSLGTIQFSCVSVPPVFVNDSSIINTVMYTGYGQGPPGALGTQVNAFQEYPFAVDFGATTPGVGASSGPGYVATLFFNNSIAGGTGQPLNAFLRVSASLNRMANSYLAATLAAAGANATFGLMPRASLRYLRDMPTQNSVIALDVGTFLGPLFYSWLSQMLLPVIVGLLVYEKEKNLRTMMKIQGLGDSAYIIVNYMYYFLLYFVFMLLIYFYGYILGAATNSLSLWTRSDPGPVIIFFILFINVQISIAFLIAALFSNAKTATVFCVVYLLIGGLLGAYLFQYFLETPGYPKANIVGLEILVPFSLYRGYYEMSAFGTVASYSKKGTADGTGITWAKLSGSGGMDTVMVIFFVEWIILGLAAYYLDQTYSSGSGIKRHPLFFLDFAFRKRLAAKAAKAAADDAAALASQPVEAPDVQACREEALGIEDPAATFILAQGLAKTYPGQDGGPVKVACRELSLSIPAGECFGLLGPNGAGKSTAINLLIGFLTPTRGRAYIRGYNLQTDLDTVYSLLGVCPQHDLLWEQLSAREHLRFYGRLKNLHGAVLEAACDKALKGVNLFSGGVGNRPCGTYSGGMKRRLSVAISLIGDPPVVFLDEPSTGLDPASRATLWDVIKEAKKDRAIVLTTHAMEEAEELCDRLGIVVDGALRCVGNPKELTSRHGGFLILTLTVPVARVANAVAFVAQLSPGSKLTYQIGGTLKFDLPVGEVTLESVFASVTDKKEELGIVDWGIANMTLEEVFIKLARDIGAESKD